MEIQIQEIIRIARLAGAAIRALREKNTLTEELKYGYELVTNSDLLSNEIIKNEIFKLYPDHEILSEEDVERSEELIKPTWIIDPIDGTVNYANGHMMAAVSIAFADNRTVRAGVVYNPFLDELFYATEKTGAFLNDQKIKVKDVSALNTCLVATGFPYVKDDAEEITARLGRVWPRVRDIRRLGSAALDICWVACSRLQGYYEGQLNAWDVAAAKLIAREAGAAIGYFKEGDGDVPDGVRCKNLIVSSPGVFEELKSLLV
ncbi:inositol monophosphatase family protein [Oscillospiraceae bacterium WX1]